MPQDTNIIPLFPDQAVVIRKCFNRPLRNEVAHMLRLMLTEDRENDLLNAMDCLDWADVIIEKVREHEHRA